MLPRDAVRAEHRFTRAVREQRGIPRAVQLRTRIVGHATVDRRGAALDGADFVQRDAGLTDERPPGLQHEPDRRVPPLTHVPHELARELRHVGERFVERVAHAQPAADVEHARSPVRAAPRDVDQPVDRDDAFVRPRELRADVHVQSHDVEACRRCLRDARNGVVRREPELRLGVSGANGVMRRRLDARCQTDQNRSHTRGSCTVDLLERVQHHQRACLTRRAELRIRLVVSVENEPVTGDPRAQRKLELPERGHVGSDPLGGEQPEHRDVRKRLRPVHDERFGVHARVRARTREQRLPAEHDKRCPEFRRERRCTNAADEQLAILDGGRVGEQLDQRAASRSTNPGSPRRHQAPCSAHRSR